MDPRIARRIVVVALVVGLAANALFDGAATGINLPIAVALGLVGITLFERGPVDRADLWLPIVALVAALPTALWTDPTVVLLDLVIVAAATAAWAVAAGGVPVTRRTAAEVAALGTWAASATAIGAVHVLGRANADRGLERGTASLGPALPIVRGLVIAGPVVFVFAALLASADAVFSRTLELATELVVDPIDPLRRALYATIVAWPVAGLLALATGFGASGVDAGSARKGAPSANEPSAPGPDGPGPSDVPHARRGRAEALTVLVAVDVLFAVFVVLQVAYLFGGRDTLELTGLTYSEYARQGYFQLVAVVVLAGLLLVAVHAVAGGTRATMAGGLTLLGLTGVILASAALRLHLYQAAYGWTELRFYVAASIAWLLVAVVLAAVLLARGRMRWLPHGLAMGAVAITLAISFLGPQSFVARQNLARVVDPSLVPEGGHSGFDVRYATSLGDDAVPELAASLDNLGETARARVLDHLRWRRDQLQHDPAVPHWAAWNLARERALAALATLPDS